MCTFALAIANFIVSYVQYFVNRPTKHCFNIFFHQSEKLIYFHFLINSHLANY